MSVPPPSMAVPPPQIIEQPPPIQTVTMPPPGVHIPSHTGPLTQVGNVSRFDYATKL